MTKATKEKVDSMSTEEAMMRLEKIREERDKYVQEVNTQIGFLNGLVLGYEEMLGLREAQNLEENTEDGP
jgi:hypothetical protein